MVNRHRFGSPGDHVLFAAGAVVVGVGLVASAWIPGVEQWLDRLAAGLVVLVVLGWLGFHALGELLLTLELRRPPREPRPGWETCLMRVDPVTGRPWREPDEDQAEPVGGGR